MIDLGKPTILGNQSEEPASCGDARLPGGKKSFDIYSSVIDFRANDVRGALYTMMRVILAGAVAQLDLEHRASIPMVAGSNPAGASFGVDGEGNSNRKE